MATKDIDKALADMFEQVAFMRYEAARGEDLSSKCRDFECQMLQRVVDLFKVAYTNQDNEE